MKQYIGGFLELELFPQPGPGYHHQALALSNARACVSHLIRQTQMQRVWLPYYTCNALLEPFEQAGVAYRFYGLNPDLTLADEIPALAPGEYLLYVNYFGLKNDYIPVLIGRYGDQLLVDNTQDYFARGYARGWSFNSARKSFGVPDGGYLYGPAQQLGSAEHYPVNTSYDAGYLIDRLRGAQSEAYAGFVAYERTLTSQPLRISGFSAALLSQVNYEAVIGKRRENYRYYHEELQQYNRLAVPLALDDLSADTVPFCYPLLVAGGVALDRSLLFKQNLFIPTLWPDVLTRQSTGYAWEKELTQGLLPLPVDHRYGPAELAKVIAAIHQLLSSSYYAC